MNNDISRPPVTEDLMMARIQVHEKHIWMLKSDLSD
jgi:DNA-binding ferritin-like protein